MADSSEFQQYESSTYWVAPARNFRTSARLHLQHLLFQNTLGYLLEPRVQGSISSSTQSELKVADLGCGNGVWLSDLDEELSRKGISASLDGYDVNPINFPAPAHLPQSITVKKLDVLARPLPQEITGVYDIVHVRAFTSIIVNADLDPLLSTALALLKPGGWLQWEELRADRYLVESPSPEISKSACETLVHIVQAGGKARGATYEFLGELDQHLKQYGFTDVHMQTTDTRKRDWKAWTEDYLMIWEELSVFFPPKAKQPQAPMTRESWIDLFAKAVQETEEGVAVHNGSAVTVVGRKAA
ncbi:uncharacterized protein GGS22DRAFT_27825 [Annulohypoxylon maeteangense]|uniref:uncharacterized protein n=1 Tax=Annulohypoxylon maeteangense TaxID=1927788 RepID=UPI00200793ED|nr:uncharacterized protein GGS22DRAFT_27825 [Annulohypoxylon maeteangense]KAI0883928.1 hypothetical protein GGS22DRAFT_27825 [Annulohypoxylon maeteangense]